MVKIVGRFERISEKAQLLLLALYLDKECNPDERDSFFEEKQELIHKEYVLTDPAGMLHLTKKGSAFCRAKNYVGTNFKRLVRNNSNDGNVALACEVLKELSNRGKVERLTQTLPFNIQNKILSFLND